MTVERAGVVEDVRVQEFAAVPMLVAVIVMTLLETLAEYSEFHASMTVFKLFMVIVDVASRLQSMPSVNGCPLIVM